jgi:hypothetical protein
MLGDPCTPKYVRLLSKSAFVDKYVTARFELGFCGNITGPFFENSSLAELPRDRLKVLAKAWLRSIPDKGNLRSIRLAMKEIGKEAKAQLSQ